MQWVSIFCSRGLGCFFSETAFNALYLFVFRCLLRCRGMIVYPEMAQSAWCGVSPPSGAKKTTPLRVFPLALVSASTS